MGYADVEWYWEVEERESKGDLRAFMSKLPSLVEWLMPYGQQYQLQINQVGVTNVNGQSPMDEF